MRENCSMTQDEALARLRKITDGIDRCEDEGESGWWETSTGATFGAKRLQELEALVVELTS